MKSIQHSDPAFEQLFAKLPPKIAKTFTFEQLEAIKKAYDFNNWNRHPVNIRVSIPILGMRFYLILSAGKERRSNQRLQVSKSTFPLWTPVNTLLITGFFILLLTSGFVTFSYVFSSLTSISIPNSPYNTSLPFIKDQSICEKTGRTWRHDKCWDSEQNPLF
ncbi:MAG: hypothetical protein PUP92_37760 [Rhizonema sp. PD38]|nr:hypothetical protein [Rhizonema sp. PD38]